MLDLNMLATCAPRELEVNERVQFASFKVVLNGKSQDLNPEQVQAVSYVAAGGVGIAATVRPEVDGSL